MAKYIFVTGGVISSLGKGLTAASLGTLLESRGLKVALQKFDPYLNVDPGTMSPFQHGEVYVLEDGAETDLDLGHYERFTDCQLSRLNNLTSGQVYQKVLNKERDGKYLGKTVQVIPHVTNEIQDRIKDLAATSQADVIITEIGGTVGDIEGLPFLEAIRAFALSVGQGNVAFVHVTYVPYIKAAGELKTKPTQQSVAKLREIGISPHFIVCRCEKPMNDEIKQKISMFCNVPAKAVIEEMDVEHSIYEVPIMLQREKMDGQLCDILQLPATPPNMEPWQGVIRKLIFPQHRKVSIAVVGKYIELQDAYKSVYEALTHGGIGNDCSVSITRIEAEEVEHQGAASLLKGFDGILVPGGFGNRGIEGKILAAQYARENQVPYLGLCLGMQVACIEFARNVLKLPANSTEFEPATPNPVITLLDEQANVTQLGGTMRLGGKPCVITAAYQSGKPTKAAACYGKLDISERHRHRYEFNNTYRNMFSLAGCTFSGTSPDGKLVEIIELENHPFFVATQAHPEFKSKPHKPHPLFQGFIKAALNKV